MATISVFRRKEKKFLMDKSVMERIIPEIEKHMEADAYCKDGQSYAISNLYYDTVNHDVIRESLQKPSYKEKLRMRCYGIPKNQDTRVFLEIKKKVDGIVTKRRVKLTYGQAKRFLKNRTYPKSEDYLTTQILREIDYYLSHEDVYPSTRISYDRQAYFDREDSNFRLTFDRNLRYLKAKREGDPVDFQDKREGILILPEQMRLMEVKVTENYPLWFIRLIQSEEILPVSFSKYGVSYKKELIDKINIRSEYINQLSHI